MKGRCNNPRRKGYENYGGRGIRVCEKWVNSFQSFLADVGPAPPGCQLDRVDNNGHYEPGNVRWATRSQQMQNTRRTKLSVDKVAEIRASSLSMYALARRYGVSRHTIMLILRGKIWK